MRLGIKLFCGVWLFANIHYAYANRCEEPAFINSLLQQAQLSLDQGLIADCRVLPNQVDQVVIVYQQIIKSYDADQMMQDYTIYLLTADQKTKKLISRYKDPDIYSSDAIQLKNIVLDTAAYQLDAGQRAIGLRISYQALSRYPYDYSLLNLYDLSKQKRILSHLTVDFLQGGDDGVCNSNYETRRSHLVVLPTQSHGMADLKVNTTVSYETSALAQGDCVSVEAKPKKRSHILKFNGQNYVIPKYLQQHAGE